MEATHAASQPASQPRYRASRKGNAHSSVQALVPLSSSFMGISMHEKRQSSWLLALLRSLHFV